MRRRVVGGMDDPAALVGIERRELPFGGENGMSLLAPQFDSVEARDAEGTATFRDADAVRRYLGSSERLAKYVERVPTLSGPVVARRRPVVFVAEQTV